jgi:hypothetical protein
MGGSFCFHIAEIRNRISNLAGIRNVFCGYFQLSLSMGADKLGE